MDDHQSLCITLSQIPAHHTKYWAPYHKQHMACLCLMDGWFKRHPNITIGRWRSSVRDRVGAFSNSLAQSVLPSLGSRPSGSIQQLPWCTSFCPPSVPVRVGTFIILVQKSSSENLFSSFLPLTTTSNTYKQHMACLRFMNAPTRSRTEDLHLPMVLLGSRSNQPSSAGLPCVACCR